jgi:lysozyme
MSADVFYDRPQLIIELTRDEGRKPGIYVDSTGNVSGGVGRNLTANGFYPGEIDLMLANDIAAAEFALDRLTPWWRSLDPVRARVLLNMVFNMGGNGLSGFIRFIASVETHDWAGAVVQMRASRWATQVGQRAVRLEHMMLTGNV